MIAPRIASLVAALVLTAQADLFAQQEPPVAPGDRVRVTVPPYLFVGTLVALGADTCVLEAEGGAEPLTLPLTSVEKFEVSLGQKSKWLAGAGYGFLAGAAFGALVGLLTFDEAAVDMPEGAGAGLGAAFGAGAGLLLGALGGGLTMTDRWEAVPLDRLRVSIVPRRNGGLAVSVSVAF